MANQSVLNTERILVMSSIICHDHEGKEWILEIREVRFANSMGMDMGTERVLVMVPENNNPHIRGIRDRWRNIVDGKIDWSKENDHQLFITPPEVREYAERLVRNLAFV